MAQIWRKPGIMSGDGTNDGDSDRFTSTEGTDNRSRDGRYTVHRPGRDVVRTTDQVAPPVPRRALDARSLRVLAAIRAELRLRKRGRYLVRYGEVRLVGPRDRRR
jgi:hypothetical protein